MPDFGGSHVPYGSTRFASLEWGEAVVWYASKATSSSGIKDIAIMQQSGAAVHSDHPER